MPAFFFANVFIFIVLHYFLILTQTAPHRGTHIPGERISLRRGGTYIPSGEHISLGICVRGNTYPGGTHITVTPVPVNDVWYVKIYMYLL